MPLRGEPPCCVKTARGASLLTPMGTSSDQHKQYQSYFPIAHTFHFPSTKLSLQKSEHRCEHFQHSTERHHLKEQCFHHFPPQRRDNFYCLSSHLLVAQNYCFPSTTHCPRSSKRKCDKPQHLFERYYPERHLLHYYYYPYLVPRPAREKNYHSWHYCLIAQSRLPQHNTLPEEFKAQV